MALAVSSNPLIVPAVLQTNSERVPALSSLQLEQREQTKAEGWRNLPRITLQSSGRVGEWDLDLLPPTPARHILL